MSVPAETTYFPDERPAAMVVSHERSGTHFLMNSLAACYGYVSLPWINFDNPRESLLLRNTRPQLRQVLMDMVVRPMANVVKSHHTVEFFEGELETITRRYVLFVIHRNPVDVMLSFWRYMYHFTPADDAGPRSDDPVSFAQAVPFGKMLRYQTQPAATVLDRWADHVRCWRQAAQANPRVVLVRYENLNGRYEETMRSFAAVLGRQPQSFSRPTRDYNVVRSGPIDPTGRGIPVDVERLERACRERVGDVMAMLGY